MADRSQYVEQFNAQRISGINAESEAGKTGRPFSFECAVTGTMGGYFNCSKSYINLGATGGATGLLSAHNMELKLPSTTDPAGHLTCAEHEIVCADSTTVNSNISFGWYQVSGDATAKTAFNVNCNFLEITGMEVGAANMFSGESPSTITHALRIRIDDVPYYICLSATAT